MSLRQFVPEEPQVVKSLLLVDGSAPEPIRNAAVELFDDQPVPVTETDIPDREDDTVLVLGEEGVLASSPLDELAEAVLLVNSDLFTTGTVGLEDVDVPAVIEGLEDVPFWLRGYPESNKEKLLLILISRLVERRAFEAGAGRLRTSFQRLSRIKDEQGTFTVYESLAQSDVDVHVYGEPDWIPSEELDVITHGGHDENFRRAWFVLFDPPSDEPLGLLAYESEPRRWHGFYTSDPDRFGSIRDHVLAHM
ncbi:MAG: DICT sensory domain-containing protein [Halodesulfurarchaeum sp.]